MSAIDAEAAVYVACSTDCFSTEPLADALRSIGELGFSKIDVSANEAGSHLKPSDVAADVGRAVKRMRGGSGLTVAAFHIELAPDVMGDQAVEHVRAMCRLARVLATPLVSLPAAAAGSDLEEEVTRLGRFNRLAQAEGVAFAIETRLGTLTENPDVAVELCHRVPGMGIALDPSHYLVGPHANKSLDALFPYVQHVRLRDTSTKSNQFQVRIGQGEVEYGRIVSQLNRCDYRGTLSVDIHDCPENSFPMQPEVRKLKYLLESLI